MIRKSDFFFTILLFACGLASLQAQQRFRAGAIFGLNVAQIMGDDVGGYHKPGLAGGLKISTTMTRKWDAHLEMLYSERGSYDKYGSPKCPNGDLRIALQYVEVPLMFSIKDWYIEEEDYYKVFAMGGLVYSRLIKARSEGSCHDALTNLFNVNDYSYSVGIGFWATRRLSFDLRSTNSINKLFNNRKHPGTQGFNSLRGYFISFRGIYHFN